jgi:hypothetical protein
MTTEHTLSLIFHVLSVFGTAESASPQELGRNAVVVLMPAVMNHGVHLSPGDSYAHKSLRDTHFSAGCISSKGC